MASPFFFKDNHPSFSEAIFLESWVISPLCRKLKPMLFWLGFFLLLTFLFGFFGETFEDQTLQVILGGSFLSFATAGTTFLLEYFADSLKTRKLSEENNLAGLLSYEAYKTAVYALRLGKRKRLEGSNSSMLFLALLKLYPELSFVLVRTLLDPKSVVEAVAKDERKQNDFLQTLEEAVQSAQERGRGVATKADLFIACMTKSPVLSDILSQATLEPQDVSHVALWQERITDEYEESRKFWLHQNLRKRGTLARSWSAGYTITLDRFGVDLGEVARKTGFPRAVGHEQERLSINRVLSRTQLNNVLLVGEPGSGKKSIIMDFVSMVEMGQAPAELQYKRVVELNLTSLAASLQGKEEFELTLDTICKEVQYAGNIILFIDEFHNFIGNETGVKAGATDVTGILSPYLASSKFQVVAVTTFGGLHQYIEPNQSLTSLFEKVEVSEISQDQALEVLEMAVPMLEKRTKRFISYPALRDAVSLSVKYIQGSPLPEKALRLLDEAMAFLPQTKEKILLPKHIAQVLKEKTQIPIGELESGEKEKLLNLEDLLHKRIIGQEEAISEVSSALRRARTEISSRKGPMGAFLFLGPTGVGKTETAKALAAVYFGSQSRMVRLDMSEFQNLKDIDRLLGSPREDGLLTTPVRENPFSLVLLDEFEKGHPNIVNLFLQVFDEGHVTDGAGRKINFQNTIIIATSNAGYQLILQAIKEKKDFAKLKEEMIAKLFQEGVFRPELINRFDAVVLFKPLEPKQLILIAHLMLTQVKENLEAKGIEFVITDQLKAKIAELGYDRTFGARNMRRVIQDKVENALATAFLKDSIKRGDAIVIDPVSFAVLHLGS
ncbi:MAG: ATP-dependent Clp protease ATP-binding subunit [bacterium]|nr:ATP-dependent Clp protease ATP-binding subunit [bacterium]